MKTPLEPTSPEKEAMREGRAYRASDPLLTSERLHARRLTFTFNASSPDDVEHRRHVLTQLLGSGGDTATIEPTFRCDYGYNIHVGKNFYANFDCVMLDVARIDIGDDVLLGPHVQLLTATHPLDPYERAEGLEGSAPIKIGHRVWLGAGVVICPNVTIGNGTTIGAGSVVTRDMPPDVVAAGNPCRILRHLEPRPARVDSP